MSVIKRTRDGIDILEHAMKGVRTSGSQGEIRGFHADPDALQMTSSCGAFEDPPVEREVIVKVRPLPPRR
jgi:hypothetical protein